MRNRVVTVLAPRTRGPRMTPFSCTASTRRQDVKTGVPEREPACAPQTNPSLVESEPSNSSRLPIARGWRSCLKFGQSVDGAFV
jgi:hypothetical protein